LDKIATQHWTKSLLHTTQYIQILLLVVPTVSPTPRLLIQMGLSPKF